jgi:hypothetical protein
MSQHGHCSICADDEDGWQETFRSPAEWGYIRFLIGYYRYTVAWKVGLLAAVTSKNQGLITNKKVAGAEGGRLPFFLLQTACGSRRADSSSNFYVTGSFLPSDSPLSHGLKHILGLFGSCPEEFLSFEGHVVCGHEGDLPRDFHAPLCVEIINHIRHVLAPGDKVLDNAPAPTDQSKHQVFTFHHGTPLFRKESRSSSQECCRQTLLFPFQRLFQADTEMPESC